MLYFQYSCTHSICYSNLDIFFDNMNPSLDEWIIKALQIKTLQFFKPTVSSITGEVVPVGGTREGPHNRVALIPSDLYVETMSNLPVRVGGAFLSDGEVVPSAGSYQALLDSNTLACEARVLDCLRAYKERVTGKYVMIGGFRHCIKFAV